jgi:hypothetical protein
LQNQSGPWVHIFDNKIAFKRIETHARVYEMWIMLS